MALFSNSMFNEIFIYNYNTVGKSVLLKYSITKLELELKLTMAKSRK